MTVHALDPDKALHHYVADDWKLDAGLPQVQVTALTQGPRGYLWVGTRGGLARFDGVKFRTFVPENTPQLPGMIIRALFTDSAGRIWIGTYKGVTVYQEGDFRGLMPPADAGGGVQSLDVRGFAELADGRALVASDRGLFVSSGGGLERWHDSEAPVHSVMTLDGAVWAGEVGRVRVFAGAVTEYPLPPDKRQAMVKSLVVYHGTVWAGTSRGLLRWNGREWVEVDELPAMAETPVDALHVDADGILWVAASDGIVRMRGNEPLPGTPGQNAYPEIQAIAEDHEGSLWLGSDTSGLVRLRNGWTKRFSVAEGLHEPTVWSLMPASDGSIWVGTTQGLSRFVDGHFELVAAPDTLPHPGVYTLLVEPDRVWLGTRAGLAWYTPEGVVAPPGAEALADAQISSIAAGDAGAYWLATSKGLCRYDAPALECFGRAAGLREVALRFVFPTRDGRLLIGSQGGLFEFANGRFVAEGAGVIGPDEDITAINQLADGSLVVGTLSESLYLNDGTGWHRFTRSDGLPINSPFFSALDDQGYLWVAGLQGLYRVPYQQLTQRRHGQIDEVDARMLLNERGDVRGAQQAFCCNGAGRAKGFVRDGVLWLPTRDGIVAVNMTEVRSNPHAPNVVVERLRIDGSWRDYPGGALTLAPDTRDLAVRFTALSFQAPDSVLFRYQLRGFDTDWQTPDDTSQRTAYYTNLPPGQYQFQVLAANNAGVWQERPATFDLTVQPFFYETRTFYLLMAVVLVAVFSGGYRLLLNNQRRQRERLRAQVDARTEELRVANEHLREYSRRLEQASRTDPLTGLWNRRHLEEQLPVDLSVFHRKLDKEPDCGLVTAFAILDLDRFKSLNDEFGHAAGDQVLREFAALVSALVRAGDYVVRWGGEEFVIVLRELAPDSAEEALRRILEAVAQHPFRVFEQEPLHITCSIGYAFYPFFPHGEASPTWEQTIEIADRALYIAKDGGRGRCVGLHATEWADPDQSVAEIRDDTRRMLGAGRLRQSEFVAGG